MRKIMCIVCCTILTSVAWSQKLHVTSTGHVTIKPTAFVFAGGDVEVVAGGSLTAESDATNSSSFVAIAGASAGDLTYKRYVTGGAALSVGALWHLVGAPVATQSINDFVTDAGNEVSVSGIKYAVAWYDNSLAQSSKWVYYDTATAPAAGDFVSGQGYSTHRDTSGTFTFTGNQATADVTQSIGGGVLDWTPVANPYTSFLPSNNSTSSVFQENLALGIFDTDHAALYIWKGGAYVPVNFATGDEQIAPGQAFMVKWLDGAPTNTFKFTETLQTIQVGASDNFSRTAPVPSILVNLSNADLTSTTELKYFSNTTTGLDIGWDAGVYEYGSLSVSSHLISDSEGVGFMLQCLPDTDYEANIIPLAVIASAGEEITFDAVTSNLPSDMDVYLEDKINNTITKINDASYTITLADAIAGIGNFYLHASRSALTIDDVSVSNTVNLYKTSNSNLRITGLQEEGKASVMMFSLTGQEVLAQSFTMQRVNDVALPALRTGVYLVQVVSENGTYTKKIIIE